MSKSAKVNKRYYWLKLKNTFFTQLTQRKMRKQEHGLEMQVVYLKMMLASVDKGGYITYQGVFDTLEEELAVEFDEDLEIVQKTIAFLEENNMITFDQDCEGYFITEAYECIGSECASAERMRRSRENKKRVSQCDNDVTKCDVDIDIDNKRIEIEKENREDIYIKIKDLFNSVCVSYLPVKKITKKRKDAINDLLEVYTMNDIHTAFKKVEESRFLKGQTKNSDGWKASFDWAINPDNMEKVLYGQYDEYGSSQPGTKFNNFNQRDYDFNNLEKQLLDQ